jgi:DNA-binding transcriptional LysR family regulator
MTITGTNLNLLTSFDALYAERSVSRAARQVGLTQSAMSAALKQLRGVFADPLFVRQAHGMLPTPRAHEVAAHVREALAALGRALAPPRFVPAEATRAFTIATSDYVELVLLPEVLARLSVAAPGVRLHVKPWSHHRVPEELARGGFDAMIGFYGKVPPHHRDAALFEERFVCVVRDGHPRVGRTLTLPTYAALGHVVVSQEATPTSVDRALAAAGLRRDVVLRVSHFSSVPAIIARTDHVAALSERVARRFARTAKLRILPHPLRMPPDRIGMVWHEGVDADPGHAWLRARFLEAAQAVAAAPGGPRRRRGLRG